MEMNHEKHEIHERKTARTRDLRGRGQCPAVCRWIGGSRAFWRRLSRGESDQIRVNPTRLRQIKAPVAESVSVSPARKPFARSAMDQRRPRGGKRNAHAFRYGAMALGGSGDVGFLRVNPTRSHQIQVNRTKSNQRRPHPGAPAPPNDPRSRPRGTDALSRKMAGRVFGDCRRLGGSPTVLVPRVADPQIWLKGPHRIPTPFPAA